MEHKTIIALFALVGGIAAALQAPLSAILERHVGVMGSVFIVHLEERSRLFSFFSLRS